MCSKCYQEQIKHEAGIQQTSLVRPNAAELSETHDHISSRLEHPAASAETGLTTAKVPIGNPIRTRCGGTSQGFRCLKRKADSPVPQSTEGTCKSV